MNVNIGKLIARNATYRPDQIAVVKDMIISGGVNVYLKDIEEVVVQHVAALEATVFGIPGEKWGKHRSLQLPLWMTSLAILPERP